MRLFSRRHSAEEREQRRFYLLPGMGGRALRRKQRLILQWAIVVGALVSLAIAGLLYLLNAKGP